MAGLLLLLLAGLAIVGGVLWSRNQPRLEHNVTYGTADGQPLLLDLYQPAPHWRSPRPAVILVHGGGWSGGSRRDFQDLGKGLAHLGYAAFSIEYRLVTATKNRWPAQLDDCQRAVRWVRAHAAQYHLEPQHVGALGGSAGGHLVALLGLRETRDNSDPELARYSSRVNCVVDLCGPTDLAEDLIPKVKQGAWANEMVRTLLGGSQEERLVAGRAASPLFDDLSEAVPFLIFHGKADDIVPLDHSERLHAALLAAGRESHLEVFDGGHGFADQQSVLHFISVTKDFLQQHLKP